MFYKKFYKPPNKSSPVLDDVEDIFFYFEKKKYSLKKIWLNFSFFLKLSKISQKYEKSTKKEQRFLLKEKKNKTIHLWWIKFTLFQHKLLFLIFFW